MTDHGRRTSQFEYLDPLIDWTAMTSMGDVTYGIDAETDGGWCLPESQLAPSGILVARAVYDTLTVPDAEGHYVPWLAESVERNDDVTTWTIRLRDGVTFHDGTPKRRQGGAAAVPDGLLERITLCGPEGYLKERLAAHTESGVTNLNVVPVRPDPIHTIERVRALVDDAPA